MQVNQSGYQCYYISLFFGQKGFGELIFWPSHSFGRLIFDNLLFCLTHFFDQLNFWQLIFCHLIFFTTNCFDSLSNYLTDQLGVWDSRPLVLFPLKIYLSLIGKEKKLSIAVHTPLSSILNSIKHGFICTKAKIYQAKKTLKNIFYIENTF